MTKINHNIENNTKTTSIIVNDSMVTTPMKYVSVLISVLADVWPSKKIRHAIQVIWYLAEQTMSNDGLLQTPLV